MKKIITILLKCVGSVGLMVMLAMEEPTLLSVFAGAVLTGLSGWLLARVDPDPEADRA